MLTPYCRLIPNRQEFEDAAEELDAVVHDLDAASISAAVGLLDNPLPGTTVNKINYHQHHHGHGHHHHHHRHITITTQSLSSNKSHPCLPGKNPHEIKAEVLQTIRDIGSSSKSIVKAAKASPEELGRLAVVTARTVPFLVAAVKGLPRGMFILNTTS